MNSFEEVRKMIASERGQCCKDICRTCRGEASGNYAVEATREDQHGRWVHKGTMPGDWIRCVAGPIRERAFNAAPALQAASADVPETSRPNDGSPRP